MTWESYRGEELSTFGAIPFRRVPSPRQCSAGCFSRASSQGSTLIPMPGMSAAAFRRAVWFVERLTKSSDDLCRTKGMESWSPIGQVSRVAAELGSWVNDVSHSRMV
jgi:hypothetical protein